MQPNFRPTDAVNKIIFADDSLIFRNLLSEKLYELNHFNKITEVDNGEQVIELIKNGVTPQLAILDLKMPILDGHETAKWIKQHQPAIKILVLTMFEDKMVKELALQSGADAVMTKNEDIAVIQTVINELINGSFQAVVANPPLLTINEIELLKFMCTNLTFDAIAIKMSISLRQVERSRESLFKIFKIYDRTSLASHLISNGIVIQN
jgi:DNA-binding NarL/FixJ family response regulator